MIDCADCFSVCLAERVTDCGKTNNLGSLNYYNAPSHRPVFLMYFAVARCSQYAAGFDLAALVTSLPLPSFLPLDLFAAVLPHSLPPSPPGVFAGTSWEFVYAHLPLKPRFVQ